MSGLPFVELGDLDGTHGWVKTKGSSTGPRTSTPTSHASV